MVSDYQILGDEIRQAGLTQRVVYTAGTSGSGSVRRTDRYFAQGSEPAATQLWTMAGSGPLPG